MARLRLVTEVRRIGNSLAVFIPAPNARKGKLREGQTVTVEIATDVPPLYGLLRDLPYEPFERRKEETKHDRI